MIIGVTGGIGSGKSTVLRAVAQRGYRVYDCDAEAKRIIVENPAVRRQMIALFGEQVYKDGKYQTQYVAARVFADKSKLERLNAIVHPAVMEDIRSQKSGVLFVESAILVSSGIDKLCDVVVTVTAPEDVRVERVLRRATEQGKPTTAAEVRARIRSQQSAVSGLADEGISGMELNNDGSTPIAELADRLIAIAR